jgi:hypothetical protein
MTHQSPTIPEAYKGIVESLHRYCLRTGKVNPEFPSGSLDPKERSHDSENSAGSGHPVSVAVPVSGDLVKA